MPKVEWIKLDIEIFNNPKITYLLLSPNGAKIYVFWQMLLIRAGKCNTGGFLYVTPRIPYTLESLTKEFGYKLKFNTSDTKNALELLEQLDMVSVSDGVICITGWEEHQNTDALDRIRRQNSERQAKYRERQKEKAEMMSCNVTDNATVTLHNDDVTQENKKEELEEEKKNDKKEKAVKPPFIELILNDSSLFAISLEDVEEWKKLYPDIDIKQEFRNMAGWCMANPTKRKTRSGIKRFINAWLSKTQKGKTENGCTGRNVDANESDAYADEFDGLFS